MATYVEVASEMRELQNAAWLLTGYNLGYCVALPVVRSPFSLPFALCPCLLSFTLFPIFFWVDKEGKGEKECRFGRVNYG